MEKIAEGSNATTCLREAWQELSVMPLFLTYFMNLHGKEVLVMKNWLRGYEKAAAYTAMKPTATAGKRRARMDCSEDIAEGSGAIFLARTG